jgi:hypothetical protein
VSAPTAGRVRQAFRSARTRILAAFLILLAFSTLVSVLAIHELLSVRVSDRIDASLRQEIEEFRRLARGRDPATGRLFGDDLEGSSGSTGSATCPAKARS